MRYNHDMIGAPAFRVNGPASAATLRANQGTYLEAIVCGSIPALPMRVSCNVSSGQPPRCVI